MAQYKFDGKYLKRGGSTIANVNGRYIRKGSGGITVANINGDKVRQGSGGTTIMNVSGDNIRQAYLWANTLRDYATPSNGPEMYLVCIPEWQESQRQILCFHQLNLTPVLGYCFSMVNYKKKPTKSLTHRFSRC